MKKEPAPTGAAVHAFPALSPSPHPALRAEEDAPFGPANPPPDNPTLSYLAYLEPSRIERFMSLQQRAEEDKNARQKAIARATQGEQEKKPCPVAIA